MHLSSRGNPDLSLISGTKLHELIHSISVYGAANDEIDDFLTNEIPDKDDTPMLFSYLRAIQFTMSIKLFLENLTKHL